MQLLCSDLPVLYRCPVAEVRYGAGGVAVLAADGGCFQAAAAVVTLPLGVLKVRAGRGCMREPTFFSWFPSSSL